MGLGHRTVAQPEDRLDHVLQIGRDLDLRRVRAERPAGMPEPFQLHAEGVLEVGDLTREDHAALGGAGFHDGQILGPGVILDLLQVRRVRAVRRREVFPADVLPRPGRLAGQLLQVRHDRLVVLRSHLHGHRDPFVRVGGPDGLRREIERKLSAGEGNHLVRRCHHFSPRIDAKTKLLTRFKTGGRLVRLDPPPCGGNNPDGRDPDGHRGPERLPRHAHY